MEQLTVHFHELALKGGNRGRFERILCENVERALGAARATRLAGRILVRTELDGAVAAERLTRVCGVAHVFRVRSFPWDAALVGEAVARELAARGTKSFRITTRRADKSHPKTSVELDREIGGIVYERTKIPVKLDGAETEVQVMVLPGEILVAYEKWGGPGGLPTGTGGRVAALMSGGIDSPVAAWRLMRRGCTVDLIHFHSHPLVDRTTQEKARDLAEKLNPWQLSTRLYLAPLARVQTEVRLRCPEPLRVVLYRRFMMRIAARLARNRRAKALVTGESLGQVASQTLDNLATVDDAVRLPILRPLIGSDKQEIIAEALRLGTWEISVRPDQDCCQLFVPPKPATRSTARQAERAEGALEVEALIADAVERTERVDF